MLRALHRRVMNGLAEQGDLLALWWVLAAAQSLVPVGNGLARSDLAPWMALCLSLGVLLRTRSVGPGPHPSLPVRSDVAHLRLRKVGQILLPAASLAWYDAASLGSLAPISVGVLISAVAALCLGLATDAERTAWSPDGMPEWLLWAGAGAVAIGLSATAGAMTHGNGALAQWKAFGPSLFLGTAFLTIFLSSARIRNLRQRAAAGRKDNQKTRPEWFRPALAFLGPSVGLWALLELLGAVGGWSRGFDAAFVVTLHVLMWVGIVWPRPVPAAVVCMLHEVVPAGGLDTEEQDGRAVPFERPPEGALRLNPLELKRTRSVYPWLVPVQRARIEALDDPVRPLWNKPPPPLAQHVIGPATFDLDRLTHAPQTREIRIQMKGQSETASLGSGDAQVRQIFVIRPFREPGDPSRRRYATYRWDEDVAEVCLQIVDASTEALWLRDGSVLVLSTGGVARAFELEIGQAIGDDAVARWMSPPQYQDYGSL